MRSGRRHRPKLRQGHAKGWASERDTARLGWPATQSHEPGPEAVAQREELRPLIRGMVAALPRVYRETLELRLIEEQSTADGRYGNPPWHIVIQSHYPSARRLRPAREATRRFRLTLAPVSGISEADFGYVESNLNACGDSEFPSLNSEFLVMPTDKESLEFVTFDSGYEALERATGSLMAIEPVVFTVPISLIVHCCMLGLQPAGVDAVRNRAQWLGGHAACGTGH